MARSWSPARGSAWGRACGTAAVLAAVSVTAACGGSDDGDASPTNAAKQDFCTQSAKLLQARSGADVRAWAAAMKKVGTPDGITASQRKGFEKAVELASTSKGDGSRNGLGSLDPKSQDGKNVLAFIGFAENTCPDSFQDALRTPSPSTQQ